MKHLKKSEYGAVILSSFALAGALVLAAPGVSARPAAHGVAAAQQSHTRDSAHFEDWLKNEVHHQLALLPYYSEIEDRNWPQQCAAPTRAPNPHLLEALPPMKTSSRSGTYAPIHFPP